MIRINIIDIKSNVSAAANWLVTSHLGRGMIIGATALAILTLPALPAVSTFGLAVGTAVAGTAVTATAAVWAMINLAN